MVSYDQSMRIEDGRRYAFIPYTKGHRLNCGNRKCAFFGRDGCIIEECACDYATRPDLKSGYWKEVPQ